MSTKMASTQPTPVDLRSLSRYPPTLYLLLQFPCDVAKQAPQIFAEMAIMRTSFLDCVTQKDSRNPC